jgi:hypothetical protein
VQERVSAAVIENLDGSKLPQAAPRVPSIVLSAHPCVSPARGDWSSLTSLAWVRKFYVYWHIKQAANGKRKTHDLPDGVYALICQLHR